MIREECYKFLKSWKSWVIIVIALGIGMFHTFDAIFYTGTSDVKINNFHPAYASFLNGVSAKGAYRTYFLWMMPVFLILAYCGGYASEKKKNIDIIHFVRCGERKKYFVNKMKMAGIVGILVNLIPNIISIILTVYFLHGKNGFMDLERWSEKEAGHFTYWCVHNAYASYFIFLISNLIIAALLSMMAQSMVIIFEDSKLAILVITAIWMGIYYGNDFFFIGYAMQPFVGENTLKTFIMSYITYVPMALIWIVAAYMVVVKKNDRI